MSYKPQVTNAMPFDIIIPTINNPTWIQRCLISIVRNTDPTTYRRILVLEGGENKELGPAIQMSDRIELCFRDRKEHSWLGAMRDIVNLDITDHFIHLHDDSMVFPGDPNWVRKLVYPMTVDPSVAASVSLLAPEAAFPNQRFETGIIPGYYYAATFAPVVFVGKTVPILECLKDVPHDMMCDYEPWIKLNMAGWRIVMCTNTVQFHKGGGSNLRVYAGPTKEEGDAFISKMQEFGLKRLREKYSPIWLTRVDRCELTPMDAVCVNRDGGFEVRM